jgi:hypothetical protein
LLIDSVVGDARVALDALDKLVEEGRGDEELEVCLDPSAQCA